MTTHIDWKTRYEATIDALKILSVCDSNQPNDIYFYRGVAAALDTIQIDYDRAINNYPIENVVQIKTTTILTVPPNNVLQQAIGQVESVIVVGVEPDGKIYFAFSEPDSLAVIGLLEVAKAKLLNNVLEQEASR